MLVLFYLKIDFKTGVKNKCCNYNYHYPSNYFFTTLILVVKRRVKTNLTHIIFLRQDEFEGNSLFLSLMKIDAHQHFWKFNAEKHGWITDDMAVIKSDFLPHHLLPELQAANIEGCIAVQADESEKENEFLLLLAKEHHFIKGIVGWVDLCAHGLEDRLSFYAEEPLLRGFRHVLQKETDRAFMLQPAFINGIAKLKPFNFTYDVLIHHDQLCFIPQFVQQFPEQKFVIDHLAKPAIKNNEIKDWQKQMLLVAQHQNVWCKVSGMITEADWKTWKPQQLQPYLDAVWEAFGANRIMFGSDYPVCNLAGSYSQWVNVLKAYTASLSEDEQAKFWGNNAISFYNVDE